MKNVLFWLFTFSFEEEEEVAALVLIMMKYLCLCFHVCKHVHARTCKRIVMFELIGQREKGEGERESGRERGRRMHVTMAHGRYWSKLNEDMDFNLCTKCFSPFGEATCGSLK